MDERAKRALAEMMPRPQSYSTRPNKENGKCEICSKYGYTYNAAYFRPGRLDELYNNICVPCSQKVADGEAGWSANIGA